MKEVRQRFSALYFQNFRLFWIAQVISLSGTWMHQVAQGWLVYRLTHSPLYLGIAAASLSLPILLFTLFGGIIADRYSKRNILIITQTLSVFPPLFLGVLTATGSVNVWHVIAIAFVIGTINAFDLPSRQSFLIEMVGRGHLLNAIALNAAAFHGARIIGPLTAGLIIAGIGLTACFYINALSFIPVIFVLKRMNIKGRMGILTHKGLMSEFREGFHHILGSRDILTLIVTIMIISLFGIPYNQFLPVFAEDILRVGAKGLGYMMGAAGFGAFIAAMAIASTGEIRRKRMYMSIASFSFPVFLILFSLSTSFFFSLFSLFVLGLTAVSFMAMANTSIQLNVGDELRGRVMSVYSLVFLGMAPFGSSTIGFIADTAGTKEALVLSGFICLLAGLYFIRRTSLKD